jgi:hypothetical protein
MGMANSTDTQTDVAEASVAGYIRSHVRAAGVHSASWVQLRSYLEERVAAPCLENREYGRGDELRWPRNTPLSAKVGTNFADKQR